MTTKTTKPTHPECSNERACLIGIARRIPTPTAPTRCEWGDARTVHTVFNLCKSTIYRAHADGKIRAVSMRERGKNRGKKLWNMDSIAAWIESMEDAAQ